MTIWDETFCPDSPSRAKAEQAATVKILIL
jgi:hypothetical protein